MAGLNPTSLGLTGAAASLFPTQAANPNLNARAAGNYNALAQADQMQKDNMKQRMKRFQDQGLGAAASLGIGL